MHHDIHERDITPELCRLCGACCRINLRLPDTDTRYRAFLRQTGHTVSPPAQVNQKDCCEKRHEATVDMGYCQHLDVKGDGEQCSFSCRIYAAPEFPELCEQYNCVSWAKAEGKFPSGSDYVEAARIALHRLRSKAGGNGA